MGVVGSTVDRQNRGVDFQDKKQDNLALNILSVLFVSSNTGRKVRWKWLLNGRGGLVAGFVEGLGCRSRFEMTGCRYGDAEYRELE